MLTEANGINVLKCPFFLLFLARANVYYQAKLVSNLAVQFVTQVKFLMSLEMIMENIKRVHNWSGIHCCHGEKTSLVVDGSVPRLFSCGSFAVLPLQGLQVWWQDQASARNTTQPETYSRTLKTSPWQKAKMSYVLNFKHSSYFH